MKKCITTIVVYVALWILAQDVVKHTCNNICRFIGKEISSKFGAPKMLIINDSLKLVANTIIVCPTNHRINQSANTTINNKTKEELSTSTDP